MSQPLYDQILALEERLFNRSTRRNVAELSQMLADEFVEFGARGVAWDKAEVLESLPEQQFVQRRLSGFKLTMLAEDVVLATYICTVPGSEGLQGSLRSSIWRQTQGRWLMVFHQGTQIAEE